MRSGSPAHLISLSYPNVAVCTSSRSYLRRLRPRVPRSERVRREQREQRERRCEGTHLQPRSRSRSRSARWERTVFAPADTGMSARPWGPVVCARAFRAMRARATRNGCTGISIIFSRTPQRVSNVWWRCSRRTDRRSPAFGPNARSLRVFAHHSAQRRRCREWARPIVAAERISSPSRALRMTVSFSTMSWGSRRRSPMTGTAMMRAAERSDCSIGPPRSIGVEKMKSSFVLVCAFRFTFVLVFCSRLLLGTFCVCVFSR